MLSDFYENSYISVNKYGKSFLFCTCFDKITFSVRKRNVFTSCMALTPSPACRTSLEKGAKLTF